MFKYLYTDKDDTYQTLDMIDVKVILTICFLILVFFFLTEKSRFFEAIYNKNDQ